MIESIGGNGRNEGSVCRTISPPGAWIGIPKSNLAIVLGIALLIMAPRTAAAHDIPAEVKVQALIKPSGNHLYLLARVPLKALRDIEFPLRGPGYLDLSRADPSLRDAAKLWISDAVELYENGVRLPQPQIVQTRVSLESDKSFLSYEKALAHVHGMRLPDDTEVYWSQGMLDVFYEYPIDSERSKFSIAPGLTRLGMRVVTVIRFLSVAGGVRVFEFEGNPGLVILDPRWYEAALLFVRSGFFHILSGPDHLLFLLCLVIPLRRFRSLVSVVTSFTAAHSLTLIASACDIAPAALWFPPLIESLIALSIVYMAIENIVCGNRLRRRWVVAFGFGLIHGFGFSFALRESLQFAGTHLVTSLFCFNLGVELGQLLVLLLLIACLGALYRFAAAERAGVVLVSAIVGHTAWHWMMERADSLTKFRPQWPEVTGVLLTDVMRWLMLVVICAGLLWCLNRLRSRQFSFRASHRAPVGLEFKRAFASPDNLQPENRGGEL